MSGHLPKLYIICLASAYQRPPGKQPDPSSECGDACICEQSRQVMDAGSPEVPLSSSAIRRSWPAG